MKFSCRPGCWVLAALHEPQRRLCSLIRRHCFTSGFISVSVYFILENSSPEFCRSLQNQSVIRRVDIHLFLIIFAGVFLGSDFLWESQVTDRENTQQLRHENTRLWKKEMRINQKTKKKHPSLLASCDELKFFFSLVEWAAASGFFRRRRANWYF